MIIYKDNKLDTNESRSTVKKKVKKDIMKLKENDEA
jgi:hypothetical protein